MFGLAGDRGYLKNMFQVASLLGGLQLAENVFAQGKVSIFIDTDLAGEDIAGNFFRFFEGVHAVGAALVFVQLGIWLWLCTFKISCMAAFQAAATASSPGVPITLM